MKKTVLSISLLALSLVSTQSFAFDFDAYKSTVDNMSKAKGLVELKISAFEESEVRAFREITGSDLSPVSVSGSTYLTDAEGKVLISPSGNFYVDKNGVKPIIGALAASALGEGTVDKFPSHALPEGVSKTADLYVFTDPTCGYCRKVDEEVQSYLGSGVVVHYIPYPRGGLSPQNPGYQMLSNALCSSDDKEKQAIAYHEITMNIDAGKYNKPGNADCAKLVETGYKLGGKIGVTGTPLLHLIPVKGDAVTVPGYSPVKTLLAGAGITYKEPAKETLQKTPSQSGGNESKTQSTEENKESSE